jgi:hypothetical protein
MIKLYRNLREIYIGIFIKPKMGHLTANNGSFPQQRTTRVGGVYLELAISVNLFLAF